MKKQKPSEPNTPDKLSKRQELFIPILLSAHSITAACADYNLDRSQFYAWRKQKAFSEALEAAQAELVADALANLRLNVSAAADRLIKLLNSADELVQLRASNSLIEHYTHLIEARDLEKRIEALEAQGNKK